jgi:hypothetical protein
MVPDFFLALISSRAIIFCELLSFSVSFMGCLQAVEKDPSAALRSFPIAIGIIAKYCEVRLIPHDFARLAAVCF